MIVYTALFGNVNRDQLAPPRTDCISRYVCFTDHPTLKIHGWTMARMPRGDRSPVLLARLVKTRPDRWFGPCTTIWHDASISLQQPAQDIVRSMTAPIMGFDHPDRRSVSAEAQTVIDLSLADREPVLAQMEEYRKDGFDVDADHGVTTTGLLARLPSAHAFNVLWEEQILKYTLRDQLSIDYCAWKTGIPIGHFAGHYRENAHMVYRRHVRSLE